jgi:FkbM family methyltransferase
MGSKMGAENLLMQEAWFSNIVRQINSKSDVSKEFIDIGTNIGQTLLKVKSLSTDIKYVGIEPNVVCVNYMYNLIRHNNFGYVRIFPVGLAEKSEMLTLYADNEFASGASMIHGFRSQQKIKHEYNTPVFSGDFILGKCNPYLIKIDVEGFELDVIKGLQETLRRESPIIICEILPNYLEKDSERYKRQIELEEILVKLDYSVYRVDEQNSKLMYLEKIGLFESMDETNYVFVSKSKTSIISELVN